MQITLLGTGVPTPNPKRRGPAQLIKAGNVNVLVDCGSGTVNQLVQVNVSPPQINNVLITHHHSDHYIDLDHFLLHAGLWELINLYTSTVQFVKRR